MIFAAAAVLHALLCALQCDYLQIAESWVAAETEAELAPEHVDRPMSATTLEKRVGSVTRNQTIKEKCR